MSDRPQVPWSSGICDCFQDVKGCCLTCWCPCITFGRIAEVADQGSTSCVVSGTVYLLVYLVTSGFGCCWYSCFYRSKLRNQYYLDEKPCSDLCTHCCCEYCALCQEYRELQNQGFDMSTGWNENMEKWKGSGGALPPTVQAAMNR
uniref:PGPS/D12 n=1 Tax=Petunia hybrida TaxID=4102 RepID=Q9ZTM8_PETHY|nr:PGPS/D12 [Petunia x hybrida]